MKKYLNHIFIDGLAGMAHGLFATLIVGTIIQQIGMLVGGSIGDMIYLIGKMAASVTGAGIGVGVACRFKETPLVVVSAAITEGFAATGLPLRGENGIRYLYFDANDNRVVYESSDTVPRTDPTFTVLETCSCPAVLVEQAFLTNPADVALFSTDEGCHSAADIYYRAICRYFGMEPQ